jgi:hypothetical protein
MSYEITSKTYGNVLPGYQGSGLLYPEVESPLEKVIHSPSPGSQPLDMLFSDRTKNLKATVKELLNEINLRKDLSGKISSGINNDICKFKTYLLEMEEITNRRYECEDLKFGRRRTQLESTVLTLEQEKRQEDRECWKDLMFLKQNLMSALTDYWEFSRKNAALNYALPAGVESPEVPENYEG